MFVCFEGIDGSGKTSAVEALTGLMRDAGGKIVTVRKSRISSDHPALANGLRAMGREEWVPEKDRQIIDIGVVAWILYNAAFYAAIDSLVIAPALEDGAVVVVDGWFYKFALRAARIGNRPLPDVLEHFRGVRLPDRVFLLDVTPETAVARLSRLTENELGNGRFADRSDAVAFISFQSEVRASLLTCAAEEEWTILSDPAYSPLDTARCAYGRLFGEDAASSQLTRRGSAL